MRDNQSLNIEVKITPQNVPSKYSEVEVINGYQAGKFLKDYCDIYIDKSFKIYLTGGDPALFPEELSKILKYKKYNTKYIIIPKLYFKADVETLKVLEQADQLFIPFANKYKEPYFMNNFLSNIDKLQKKDKITAILNPAEFLDTKKLFSVLRVIKGLGVKSFILEDQSYLEKQVFDNFILEGNFQKQEYPKNFFMNILTDGTIITSKKNSSIFKPVVNLIFNDDFISKKTVF